MTSYVYVNLQIDKEKYKSIETRPNERDTKE